MITFSAESFDGTWNLAWEEALLTLRSESVFLLWRNGPTVVIGRNQNAWEEVHWPTMEKYAIPIVRRISGGGAVYHDLGNLNFSYLLNAPLGEIDTASLTLPIILYLRKIGVDAEPSGRNDITVQGKKISGCALHKQHGRLLFHGTILFQTNLERLAEVLNISDLKYSSSAIPSVRSRVGNVAEFLPSDKSLEEFQEELLDFMKEKESIHEEQLTPQERQRIKLMQKEKYRQHDWNYGVSRPFQKKFVKKYPWGILDIRFDVDREIIRDASIYGDFMAQDDTQQIREKLIGLHLTRDVIKTHLPESVIRSVFPDLSQEQFLGQCELS